MCTLCRSRWWPMTGLFTLMDSEDQLFADLVCRAGRASALHFASMWAPATYLFRHRTHTRVLSQTGMTAYSLARLRGKWRGTVKKAAVRDKCTLMRLLNYSRTYHCPAIICSRKCTVHTKLALHTKVLRSETEFPDRHFSNALCPHNKHFSVSTYTFSHKVNSDTGAR